MKRKTKKEKRQEENPVENEAKNIKIITKKERNCLTHVLTYCNSQFFVFVLNVLLPDEAIGKLIKRPC